jgi:hypothetical protein
MNKNDILAEIRRTTTENDGVPLGKNRFRSETGIREADWLGKHWLRWADAIREAGFSPNVFQVGPPEEQLLEKLTALVRELGHYPIKAEFRMKRRSDSSFPGDHAFFRRFGRKHQIAAKLVKYCLAHNGYEDVVEICKPLAQLPETPQKLPQNPRQIGSVYLLKSGRNYKIGRTNAIGRRQYELAIQLPEKLTTIHQIKTDDPVGIEAYWHQRFKDRRKNGEWFELTPEDVSAFKRRKFM